MIGSILQNILTEKKMTAAELSRTAGIPSQTIYSILKRDNMKTDLDTLIKICNVLDVSIEIFYRDYINSSCKNEILSNEERCIILAYRTLNSTARQKISEYINDLEKSGLYKETQQTQIEVMKAARSDENTPRSIASITSDKLSRLKNAPSVYKDDNQTE